MREGDNGRRHLHDHGYILVELAVSGVAWPTIASVSGTISYWLWSDQLEVGGSLVFLTLALAAGRNRLPFDMV